jgi:hypothetical protein
MLQVKGSSGPWFWHLYAQLTATLESRGFNSQTTHLPAITWLLLLYRAWLNVRSFVLFVNCIKVVGCADLRPAPTHSDADGQLPLSFERLDERSAVLRCNDSLETWYVTCRDTRWLGDVTQINCSAVGVEPTRNGGLFTCVVITIRVFDVTQDVFAADCLMLTASC